MPTEPVNLAPLQRVQRWHVWLLVWRVHRWLGLGAGLLLVLLSATGSLLVVHHELEAWLEADRHSVPAATPGTPPVPLADIARTVATRAPAGHRLFRIFPAETPTATHKVLTVGPDQTTRWTYFVVPATGEILWQGRDLDLLTPWLLGLHMQLHAGDGGYVVTGLAGILLVLLALTGLYLHRDRLAQLWRHPFRLRLGWRVALSDLHKWIGILTLYFPLVLGVTGTLYCWRILAAPDPVEIKTPFDATRLPAIEPLLAAAQAALPDAEVLRVQLPAQAGGTLSILLLHREAPPWQKFSRADFDPATGRLRTLRVARDLPAGDQFASMLAPLHFGFYGATWVKWAYCLGGLAPAGLALTGAGLWWVRRRKGRADQTQTGKAP